MLLWSGHRTSISSLQGAIEAIPLPEPSNAMRPSSISAAALAFVLAATPSLAFSPSSPQPTLRVARAVTSIAPTQSASTLTRRYVAKSSSITQLRMADAAAAAPAEEEPENSVGGGTATLSQEIFNLIKASELVVVFSGLHVAHRVLFMISIVLLL
jgi:hypothetical protein